MRAADLKTEHMREPLGIDAARPRLSWRCVGNQMQSAYEIEAYSDGELFWSSEKVESGEIQAFLGKRCRSRQRISWRVRLWNEAGEAGAWSQETHFEMGLLDPAAEFQAKWILPENSPDPEKHQPASYLRKIFCFKEEVFKNTFKNDSREIAAADGKNGGKNSGKHSARVYITAHGIYEAYLNGERIGDFVLAPGSYSYHKNPAYQTYDVTELLREGENEILVLLGDGWYRSCTGIDGKRNVFGEELALLFQLEVDGKPVCVSDKSWQATQEGPLRENDMQQGEVYDARLEEPGGWHEVKETEFPKEVLSCSNAVPVTEHERFRGELFAAPNGELLIDYGQNLAGYVEFSLQAHEGDTLILSHGESLDENGNFTMENFQDKNRHQEGGARQQVVYICKEGWNHYKTRCSIWGFRYARVETEIDLKDAQFTAIAVYSQMEQTGTFVCSDERVNQLVKNSLWSQKSNFCDVPTDCPTRERAAWTGDMAVYADTGITMMDCYTVIRKWLKECRLNQYEDGKVANVAPTGPKEDPMMGILSGSVGWGDACIIVPYVLYQRFGDRSILEENYEMMCRWYGFLEKRAGQKGIADGKEKDNPYEAYTIDSGIDYGEWCEPDVDSVSAMYRPQYKIATAYFAASGALLARIAEILGEEEDARHYGETARMAKKAFRYVATEQGEIRSDRQADYVRAIAFGLLDDAESKKAAEKLDQMVMENGYHLNTGFLSTPFLCEVLAENGYVETAYRLLLQDTCPGWLYEVKKGATTIWEHWDGISETGEVKESLNHYSYGAVCGWLFSGVCGIRLREGRLQLRPHPHPLLRFARAVYHSPYGQIVSRWEYDGQGKVRYEFEIPPNLMAEVHLPDGRTEHPGAGKVSYLS